MKKVLVVEDEETSFLTIDRALSSDYEILRVKTVEHSKAAMNNFQFDLFLLDIMLPDGDGFQIFHHLKTLPQHQDKPVLFLTARSGVDDKVLGLNLGADDYLTKPIDPKELKARIDNRIQKYSANSHSKALDFGPILLDQDRQLVQLRDQYGQEDLSLTPIEFKILSFLCKNVNQTFTREQVIHNVWGNAIHIQPRNVDTHITSIRKKLKQQGASIESVYGSGYRFNPNTLEKHSA